MTLQEYLLKKQQIARLKNLLKRRFFTREALECMRLIIECKKFDHELREKIANEVRNNNE